MTPSLPETVQRTMKHYAMTHRGDTVVAAVSGGPDSCAMLGALHVLQPGLEISIVVAHLNHRLRGEASEEDAQFVSDLAGRWGLPCITQSTDIAETARKGRISIEAAARNARYAFLLSVAREHGAAAAAVAHTREDRAETFFMHLLRGAGPAGLTSMRPVRPLTDSMRLIRPLVECTHQEVDAFNLTLGIEPRLDSSNKDPRYFRNRIRHRLLPLLREEFCSQIDRNLERLMQIWQAESDYLEAQASKAMQSVGTEVVDLDLFANAGLRLDRSAFMNLSLPLQRRLVRRAYRQVHGNIQDLNFQHVENLLHWLQTDVDTGLWTFPGGVQVQVQGNGIFLGTRAVEARPEERCSPVPVPGVIRMDSSNLVLETRVFEYDKNKTFPRDVNTVWIDFEKVSQLWLRQARPGDRFRPLGCNGSQKLQDFFVNAKVPRQRRWKAPVVLSGDQIVWVVGHRLDDRYKITENTKTSLELRLVPVEGR